MTPDQVSLWIVNFKRSDALHATLRSWLASYPFTDVNVIMNDPTSPDVRIPDVKVWRNIFHHPLETSSIAHSWNQCMHHTFLTRDWCLMSQDDVEVVPGWHELITPAYDTYVAPVGDTVQLQSLAGFRQVGWFDERFRAVGGPEADYLLRMLRTYPDQLSAHDEHVWQLRHNDVGLAHHWRAAPKVGEVAATRAAFNVPLAWRECFVRWVEKWGVGVDELMCSQLYDTPCRWDEIDWYPSFTRRLEELGRI